MSKVHLIENCGGCIYQWDGRCVKAKAHIDTFEGFPDWCPFPDLPERRVEEEHNDDESITVDLLAGGWNACLEAITGGTYDKTEDD